MRRFINILILILVIVGSVSAQSLDDLRKKAYDASIEAVNKGKNRKSAYEEYLERQEIEAAKKEAEAEEEAEEAEADTENNKLLKFQWFQEVEVDKDSDEETELCNALAATVFNNLLRDENKAFRVYCAGVADYVWFWYRFTKEGDGYHHVDLYTDDNGNVGHGLCSGILKDWRYIKVKNTLTGTVSTAILIYIGDGNFKMLLIQDNNNLNNFAIFF